MPAFLFGPLGGMVALEGVQPDVSVASARPSTEFLSGGGVRSVMRGRYASRSWTLGWGWKGPEVVSVLAAAAQGLLDTCWLYDAAAARENMLAPHLTAGSGTRVQVGSVSLGSVASGHSVQVPVLSDRMFTASVWSAAASGATVARYRLDAGAWVDIVAPPGTGTRCCAISFTPSAAAVLTLEVTTTGVSGLRVHDGTPDGLWFPGSWSPCKVSVQDPQRTLQLVTDTESRSSFAVTLQEVGKPGII